MIANLILSIILSEIGARHINFLYKQEISELSFPDEILLRSKYRKILLAIIFFICAMILINLPTREFLFLMTAIYFLALIICTDFEQYIIFDKILIPFAIVGIIFAINADKIIAAIIGGGIFLIIAILTNGIGGGDIKLVAVLGLWLGTDKLLQVVIISCIFGGIAATILILAKKKNRNDFFAYGPYFAITTIFIICLNYIS